MSLYTTYKFILRNTYKLSSNVYRTNYTMHHKSKIIRENRSGGKNSSIVIMNKKDYNRKIDDMINEGIQQKQYKETDGNILKELESFQSFLYRHFKNSPHYRQMLASSHQPARSFATAKTHKFKNISDIGCGHTKMLN